MSWERTGWIARALSTLLLACLALAALTVPSISPGSPNELAASYDDVNDNEGEEVPDDVLDELSLLLTWAGGGASGVIGRLCDVSAAAASGSPCTVAQNEIMRVSVAAALTSKGWPSEPPPDFTLRLSDGSERPPVDQALDTLFWWIPLDATTGNAMLVMRQGGNQAQIPVQITERTGQPLVAAAWQRDGPDAPTELQPSGRAGNRLTIRLAGFPANQEVALLLFRQVESHALGSFATLDQPLVSVPADDRGTATYVWDTDRDQEPDHYAIYTVPASVSNGIFPDQGAQLCVTPRDGAELCGSSAAAIGPEQVIRRLIARSVALAARSWSNVSRDPTRPSTDLECAYADLALAAHRAQLQELHASGDIVDARLTRKVRVLSVSEKDPAVLRSGIEATVVERWDGKIRHADGSEDDIEPGRQVWQYVLKRKSSGTSSPVGSPCTARLVISEATLQP